jgi:hypothetical protein
MYYSTNINIHIIMIQFLPKKLKKLKLIIKERNDIVNREQLVFGKGAIAA